VDGATCPPCSADGSTHTESNKLCRKVKHRARPNIVSRKRRPKRAPIRRRSRRRQRRGEPHTEESFSYITHSHSGIDEKRPTEKCVRASTSLNRSIDTSCRALMLARLAWPHRRRGLASDGVRYADARSSVGRRVRSVTKLRLEWYGGVF